MGETFVPPSSLTSHGRRKVFSGVVRNIFTVKNAAEPAVVEVYDRSVAEDDTICRVASSNSPWGIKGKASDIATADAQSTTTSSRSMELAFKLKRPALAILGPYWKRPRVLSGSKQPDNISVAAPLGTASVFA